MTSVRTGQVSRRLQAKMQSYRNKDENQNGKQLRRIPLNVRAISAKNIYQKTTHSTVTF